MATLFVDKVDPQSGTSLEIGSSGDTITIPSGATITNNGTQTGFGGTNTPAFSVQDNAVQAIPNTTWTKLVWQTEDYDTDNAFASDKFTVPAGKAGKYVFYASWQFAISTDFNEQRIAIYKNGSGADPDFQGFHDHYGSIQISKTLDLAVSDYIEVYAYQNSGSQQNTLGNNIFQGFKLVE
jgi:hypothetical protein